MKEDVFLALAFIAVIIFGYFLMVKLDAFLENNPTSAAEVCSLA